MTTAMGWPEIYPVDLPGKLPICFECGIPGCGWRTYHKNEDGARAERERHIINSCPTEVQVDMSIITELWDKVDDVVTWLRTNPEAKGTEEAFKKQGQAQGLAHALYLMSRPHFADPQAVAVHAGQRYKARAAGESIDTPGVSGYNPMPAPTPKKAAAKATRTQVEGDAAAKTTAALSDANRQLIVNSLAANLPIESIAKVVKVSKDVVLQVQAEVNKTEKINAS